MQNAVAFANNDIATIAWSYGKRPDGCMGFALYRIDAKGRQTVLPSHAVFKGNQIKPGQTTAEFPIQKFYWKDPYARLAGEKANSFIFKYKIVPLEGKPGRLRPMTTLPALITNTVELTSQCSPALAATFNRGLISTQHVAQALKGNLDLHGFLAKIGAKGNKLRQDLTGDTLGTLKAFLTRAKRSGKIYAALYELTDKELIASLVAIGTRLNIVLADIATEPPPVEAPENRAAWNRIKRSARTKLYRLAPSNHIVHNKFLIYADARGPRAVLTGSTNWTATGMCAQTNNVLVIDDPKVARRYMAYWNALKADELAHEKNSKSFQAPALRKLDCRGQDFSLDAKAGRHVKSALTSYFSPNTPKARGAKGPGETEPVDMKDLKRRIMGAKSAVLFLAFIPGTPSIVNFAAAAQRKNKKLFVRGCVTSPDASGAFYYALRGTSPPKRTLTKGQKTNTPSVKEDPRVIAAKALTTADAPKGWVAELLNAGFAITHDKIVVIDPFAADCVVVTGSHNLGYQASYNNDENLVLIRGNQKLALAYATHVLDVYDHFAWRWTLAKGNKLSADSYLKSTPDAWLNWYFDAKGKIKIAQLRFWLEATVSGSS
jgi:phosphatidylserine/phosphatidylglycerophosphate/cardiolipin synthase-like enzyme